MRRRTTATAIVAALLTATVVASAAASADPAPDAQASAPQVPQDQSQPAQAPVGQGQGETEAAGLIVKTTDSSATSSAIAKTADAGLPGDAAVATTASGAVGTTVVKFDDTVPLDQAQAAAAAVEKRDDVQWAVPDTIVQTQDASTPPIKPNDPLFPNQYNLWDRTRAGGGYSLKAPSLWRSTTGRGVVVAVIDTGILPAHPDLSHQLVRGYDFVSSNTFSRDMPGRDPYPNDPGDWTRADQCGRDYPAQFTPSDWHGTHVAGIIGAVANNKRGVAGVAPTVKIQPIRAVAACGGRLSDILAAITWASGGHVNGVPDNATPAKIINLSLGSLFSKPAAAASACRAWSSVATAAQARGATLVAAAGNDSWTTRVLASRSVPAACNGFLSVGSISRTGHRAYYSNVGTSVDLSAPGGDDLFDRYFLRTSYGAVASTVNSGVTKPDVDGYTYARYEGTSMAAPAVSAAAAMVYSLGVHSPTAIARVLKASTTPFAPAHTATVNWRKLTMQFSDGRYRTFNLYCAKNECGSGILNLEKIPAPIGASTISGSATAGSTLKVTSSWTRSVPVTVRWYVDGVYAASGSTYRVRSSDEGRSIHARTTPSAAPYNVIGISSPSVTVPAP